MEKEHKIMANTSANFQHNDQLSEQLSEIIPGKNEDKYESNVVCATAYQNPPSRQADTFETNADVNSSSDSCQTITDKKILEEQIKQETDSGTLQKIASQSYKTSTIAENKAEYRGQSQENISVRTPQRTLMVDGIPVYDIIYNGEEKTILLLGPVRSGKMTLVNALMNYILGSSLLNKVKYKFPSTHTEGQGTSQSSKMKIVKVPFSKDHNIKYPLNIIVIPGPGTNGSESILSDLRTLEKGPYRFINLICIVVTSGCRTTQDIKQIIEDINSALPENSSEDLIVPFVTFDDGGHAVVLDVIGNIGLSYKTHFKVNNSHLYSSGESESRWNARQTTLKRFFEVVDKNSKHEIKPPGPWNSWKSHLYSYRKYPAKN